MKKILPIISLLILLLSACHSDSRQLALLDDAENAMTSAPDSALTILRDIESNRLNRTDNARYALLLSQALDKNFIDVTNDSLINIAVEYYENSSNNHYKGMAYFYKSRVLENAGDYEQAIKYSILAEDVLKNTDEYNMLALILGNRGDIYVEQYRLEEAIDLKRQAIIYYEKCENWKNLAYTHLRLSNILKLEHPADSVLKHIDIAHDIALNLNNEEILFAVENFRASFYDYIKEYDKAITTLHSAFKQYPAHILNFDDYFLMSRIYYNIGKPDSALFYLDNFCIQLAQTQSAKETISIFKSNIYSSMKDYLNAYLNYQEYTNSIIQSGLFEQNNSIIELEEKYRTELLKKEKLLLQERNIHIILISITLFLLAGGLFCFQLWRKHTQLSYFYHLYETTKQSKADILNRYNDISERLDTQLKNKQLYDNSLKNRIDMLETLIELAESNESNKARFYDHCRTYINVCNKNENSFVNDIREIASLYQEHFVENLQQRFPQLSDEEVIMCCLILLDFKTNHIRVLFNHSHMQSVYSKRTRLRKKLGLDNELDIRQFLLTI